MTAAVWKFTDPPNVAVFTTRQVIHEGVPVVYVSHDSDDGAWQFHCGVPTTPDDAMVVSLKNMLDKDPTLAALADLPLGWIAERTDPASEWKRSRHSADS
jgi:hypothetical protein